MRRRVWPLWAIASTLVALSLVAASCSGPNPFDSAALNSSASALPDSTISQTTAIRLAPGDKIHVTVFGEDKLTGDYQIDTAGYVALPLAGSVKAVGLTAPQLEKALTRQFKGSYLRNPKVTVEVMTYRPFYVLGEVQKPGEYPYRSGLNVLSAMATAGGATYRASKSKVYIQRAGTTVLKEYEQSPSIAVNPGDLVRVPERYF